MSLWSIAQDKRQEALQIANTDNPERLYHLGRMDALNECARHIEKWIDEILRKCAELESRSGEMTAKMVLDWIKGEIGRPNNISLS